MKAKLLSVVVTLLAASPSFANTVAYRLSWDNEPVQMEIQKDEFNSYSLQLLYKPADPKLVQQYELRQGSMQIAPYKNSEALAVVKNGSSRNPYQAFLLDGSLFIADRIGWITELPVSADNKVEIQYTSDPIALKIQVSPLNETYKAPQLYVYFEHRLYDFGKREGLVIPELSFNKATDVLTLGNKTIERTSLWTKVLSLIPSTIKIRGIGKDHEVVSITQNEAFGSKNTINKKLAWYLNTESSLPSNQKAVGDLSSGSTYAPQVAVVGLAGYRAARAQNRGLFDSLTSEIFGQDLAIKSIVDEIQEAKNNGIKKPKVLVLMGPTGGGKTFTAEKVGEKLYPGKVLSINGNEYSAHKESLDYQRLFGTRGGIAPQDGLLVEMVEKNPDGFALIVNEIEKMHPDIFKMLMEFLDTGDIHNKSGKKVHVDHLLVLGTSNRGVKRLFPIGSNEWSQKEIDARIKSHSQEQLASLFEQTDGLRDSFRLPPEVVKRIDKFILFGPTSKEAALQISKAMFLELSELYRVKYEVDFQVDSAVSDDVGLSIWQTSNDARSVNRAARRMMSQFLDEAAGESEQDGLRLKPGDQVQVTLKVDPLGHKSYVASANGHTLSIEGFKNPITNPLLDPVLRERLRNLHQSMSETVIGQEATISELVDGVIGYYGQSLKRPFSAFLVGVSGNGKTEMGRALAKALYGDKARVRILPLGNITSLSDFENVFGSSAQFQGGDVERAFEKILRENPDGAVIVLDEASNMGGNSPEMKNTLFKKLYDIFEEGRYVSPIDGREYDLRKFQFILTGNDGEEAFLGMTADDLILKTYQDESDPDKVREKLRKAGIPNAFLNRMDMIALTKPLLKSEIEGVTKKLWLEQKANFAKLYPGLEIEAGPNLLQQVGETFFTADQGGRASRKVLEGKVGAAISKAIVFSKINAHDLSGTRIVVNLEDNATKKAYAASNRKRAVNINVQLFVHNELIYSNSHNVTRTAPQQILLNPKAATKVSFHEAGHAVGNDEDLTEEGVEFITIRGGSTAKIKYYGYARYDQLQKSNDANINRQIVIAKIARLYAGTLSQQMAGFPKDSGWTNDLEQIKKLGTEYLTTWGLEDELLGTPLSHEGKSTLNGDQQNLLDKHLRLLMKAGEEQARAKLKKNWRLIRAISAELLSKGQIDRQRFEELRELYGYREDRPTKTYQDYRESKTGVEGQWSCRDVLRQAI
jgi:ATP-dependent Clp protease ATP-binding subunit ClpA